MKACILTEDPAGIQMLIDKETKKGKKRKAAENKKQTGNRPKAAKKTTPPKSLTKGHGDDDSGRDRLIETELNDSSEYSDEDFTGEPKPVEETNILQDKAPEVGDYLLVELPVEEGKTKGTMFNYIAKVLCLESDENPSVVRVPFLRRTTKMSDAFIIPAIEDEGDVKLEQVKGFLFASLPAPTSMLKRFVRFQHSLSSCNVK